MSVVQVDTPPVVAALTDPGSFLEYGSGVRHRAQAFGMAARRPAGDGVTAGLGRIAGRTVAVYAQDRAAFGGSVGEMHAHKIAQLQARSLRVRCPIIGLIDSGGARIQEGVAALDGYGAVFSANVRASGRVPQISVILGACAGGAVYSPALTDIVIMRSDAHMFLTGPAVVRAVTFEQVTPSSLGGASVHGRSSGVAHLIARDTAHALELACRVLSYLPSSCWSSPPLSPHAAADPMPVVPSECRKVYDIRPVIKGVVDRESLLELQPGFARNLVIGLARVGGGPVGVIANQPMALGGCLDSSAAEKGARFVRLCDAFGLPLVVLVDTPGFLPGRAQEEGGVIRRGAKLLHAFAEATVPRVTVVLRKAYGGAYIVMNSKSLGADAVYAWPGASLGVMGAEGAADIIHRHGSREQLIRDYQAQALDPVVAAERMSIDAIITPTETRDVVAKSLEAFAGALSPGFRHDNIPL